MKTKNYPARLARRASASVLSFIVALFAVCAAAFAAPADPDPGFGAGGTVLTEFNVNASARVVLVQPDSKIIVAGFIVYQSNGDYDFAVARYHPDGTPDAAFGTNGRTITPLLVRDTVRAGVLQADGKILVGGSASGSFALVRYNADGTLDGSFGTGGKTITPFSTSSSEIRTLLLQPDGKIVAVGGDDNFYVYLSRYHPDGTLDSSFGTGGKVTTHAANQGVRGKLALLQADGKILVGGDFWINGDSTNSALFRYNADGTPDDSFGGDGLVYYSLSASHDSIEKILFRSDGKLMSIGYSVNIEENRADYALGVYQADGTPDTSFGDQGFKIVPADGRIEINAALIEPDGKIVIGGRKSDPFGSRWRFHIARLNANGSYDFTFGNGGRLGLPVGGRSAGYALAIQPDGKLILAGEGTVIGSNKARFALNRLLGGDGAIPTSANITGRVINDFGRLGMGGMTVILTGGALSAPRFAQTNPFGFYRFKDLPVGAQYTVTASGKRSASYTNALQILLNGDENADEIIYRLP